MNSLQLVCLARYILFKHPAKRAYAFIQLLGKKQSPHIAVIIYRLLEIEKQRFYCWCSKNKIVPSFFNIPDYINSTSPVFSYGVLEAVLK